MDDTQKNQSAGTTENRSREPEQPVVHEVESQDEVKQRSSGKQECACRKPALKKKTVAKQTSSRKPIQEPSSSESSDDSSDSSDTETESESESSSEDERAIRKNKKLKKARKAKEALKEKKRRAIVSDDDDDSEDTATDSDGAASLQSQIDSLTLKLKMAERSKKSARSTTQRKRASDKSPGKSKRKSSKSTGADYKRVDQLWDSTIHNYKLKESAEEDETEFAEYAFLVRRCFNWENKYTDTVVDIKSKQLRTVLAEVMKDCKSVSLDAEEPTLDPNILFLYLEELRAHYKKTLKVMIKTQKKRKVIKKLEQQKKLCKSLVSFIDEDYADTKKTLYPLLKAGNITFDLTWALFKPNEVAITSCYGSWDEARCFKVDYATKNSSMQRGEWYCVEGKYMEYDGKDLGYGDFEADVDGFKGPRKITSLAVYPLKYHDDAEGMRKKLVDRGKQFVSMKGMQYKFHCGMAFMKKKKLVAKIHINGRVMVDPATFRRINPNYPISFIKPKVSVWSDDEDDDDEDGSCCEHSDDEEDAEAEVGLLKKDVDTTPKYKTTLDVDNKTGFLVEVKVEVDEDGHAIEPEHIERDVKVTDDDLLITSPVVLGFAFSEKLWLEFAISGLREIEYNEDAFDSLVLPSDHKEIVRALVESHKFNAAKTIDDVIQGKGKGLVAVLHGPPGTGKTLTAESISELLKCPLYMVSAGELGTEAARLEIELQKILDIAHSWGAVLLLDEADVFLEQREPQDVHRNALVSIFLRQLEYFQGILFLTTNRVQHFDEAFHSRIHLPLKYKALKHDARKAVWKTFLELVRKSDADSIVVLSEKDLVTLSMNKLNGRQIKNVVRTAQALALRAGRKLDMGHLERVLKMTDEFATPAQKQATEESMYK
ncbi:hypothetical protein LTR08_001528 [Meristemomyces frigidus]|nr:hypothetical protein LTR08_001528 [Meristemomyces frigidus]